jgi:Domain found in Dishevelled, Egl-10, and Pleckstrin (DEP)/Phosphatidylinositol 3- and 4-kinase
VDEPPVLHRGSSLKSSASISRAAAKWDTDKYALRMYAFKHLFHPTEGVPMRDYIRSLRSYRNCFKASELVDIIMEHANFADRAAAVAIGQKLQDDKVITRLGHRDKPFEDTDKIYQSNIANHCRDAHHADITTEKGHVHCWKEFKLEKHQAPLKSVELKIPCDMIDLQSLDFWTEAVFLPNPVKGQKLGYRMVSHPLMYCKFTEAEIPATVGNSGEDSHLVDVDSPPDDPSNPSYSQGSLSDDETISQFSTDITMSPGVVGSVVVRKVFSSIARPMIIELRRPMEEACIDDDSNHEVIAPHVLVKEGDNLGQDMCVEVMFRCFNMIWEHSPELFPDMSQIPFAFSYEVFPTGVKRGFMEAVSGLESLNGFDWNAWKLRAKDPVVLKRMIMSAAGSYVGAYILGAADRHQDNVQIQDGLTMMHIDFGFLLGSTPPIDAPRFAIYPEMEKAFVEMNAWEMFVDACENAFLAIRRLAPAVLRTCVMLFSKFGYSENAVRIFLADKFSLNTHEKHEKVAGALVRNQVKHSSADWKTRFKAYSHNHVDPTFYALLEKRFPPAVLAMKIVDAKEQRLSKKLSSVVVTKSEPEEYERLSL